MDFISFLFFVLIFLFSVVIHEVSHGVVANALGDPTARLFGRLTLNPLKHLEPFGSIILPALFFIFGRMFGGGMIFGYAKPVPINPYNLRDQKWGVARVAVAGPGANFLIAVIFGTSMRFLPLASNIYFDGLYLIFSQIVWINVLLGIFNLIPIPPFDGSRILFAFLPYGTENFKALLEKYSLLLIIFVLFFGIQAVSFLSSVLFRLIVGKGFPALF